MILRKLPLALFVLGLLLVSCNNDDDATAAFELRDELEVYNEDIEEIETYLSTHFFNYEDFDFADPYSEANDSFELSFGVIEGDNSDKTPLMNDSRLESKTITQNDVDYTLYILKVREGLGKPLHRLDEAIVTYKGTLDDETLFDSAVNPVALNLTAGGTSSGVVTGFKEGLVEFKTATSIESAEDGSLSYQGHGIGAVFIPSGLGYFSSSAGDIPSYTPIFFRINLLGRNNTDFDGDGIPSHLEDADVDSDAEYKNTDGDSFVNIVDADDDGDLIPTIDEIEQVSENFPTRADAENHTLESNEFFVSVIKEGNDTYTLKTIILTDSNNNGTPDYLEAI